MEGLLMCLVMNTWGCGCAVTWPHRTSSLPFHETSSDSYSMCHSPEQQKYRYTIKYDVNIQ